MPPKTPNPNALTLKEAIAYAGALVALGFAWADLKGEMRLIRELRAEDMRRIERVESELKEIKTFVWKAAP